MAALRARAPRQSEPLARTSLHQGNNKGEVNHIRRIVLACERDMEEMLGGVCLAISGSWWGSINISFKHKKQSNNFLRYDLSFSHITFLASFFKVTI